jgi:glutamyl-tRNA synthetase
MIHGPDGAKLSKRHGAVSVMQYRDDGYLPHALLNYIARLGWSHGDQEIFSRAEMIELFRIDDVNKSASRFDFDKLAWLNQHYLKTEAPEAIAPHFLWHLRAAGYALERGPKPEDVIVALRDRVKTLKEMAERARVWYVGFEQYDEAAVAKHFGGRAGEALAACRDQLAAIPDAEWRPERVDQALKARPRRWGRGSARSRSRCVSRSPDAGVAVDRAHGVSVRQARGAGADRARARQDRRPRLSLARTPGWAGSWPGL